MSGTGSAGAVVVATDLVLAHGSHTAIAGGSFSVPAGTRCALVGPNGSGKSSILDAIAGLLRPAGGSLVVHGGDRRGAVSYVLQATEVPAHLPLTVREVVRMGRYGRTGAVGTLGAAGRAAVQQAMARMDISALADRQLLELSGGQRQRALVAQGLCAEADVLLLDEPTTALDVVSRRRVQDALEAERSAGRTVVFSTHDLSEAALADVVVLLAGRIVAAGAAPEVLTAENLTDAYRGHLVDVGGLAVVDDPHHHGSRADRHDGHDHA